MTDTNARKVLRSTQAARVFKLFEGVEVRGRTRKSGPAGCWAAMMAIGAPYTRSAVYKWNWPKERQGTGGVIPGRAIWWIEKAARMFGVHLPPGALDSRAEVVRSGFGRALLE